MAAFSQTPPAQASPYGPRDALWERSLEVVLLHEGRGVRAATWAEQEAVCGGSRPVTWMTPAPRTFPERLLRPAAVRALL